MELTLIWFILVGVLFTGFFFFTWNNDETPEENLADLRHDLDIIKTVAAEKKCELPK